MSDAVGTISNILQSQWSLSSPSASQVQWSTTRVDSALFLQSSEQYAIGCYNPPSPTTVEPITEGAWRVTERVMIDIIIKVPPGNTAAQMLQTRENMRLEVYRIIHHNETSISGIGDAYVERETNKSEGPDLLRITLQVACITFNYQT